jgi:hypothetical protein
MPNIFSNLPLHNVKDNTVWLDIWIKFCLNVGKSGPKYQNIYIKASFERPKHIKLLLKLLNKPWVETACLGENWLSKK